MSGHSKWAQIKRKKSVTDEKRGRMYSKLLRAIEVAAREGGGNVDGNMTLSSAVQKARDYSVPVDNIERAIKRGAGAGADAARFEEVTYEGYGPGGVAILIEAMTEGTQEAWRGCSTGGGSSWSTSRWPPTRTG